MSEHRRRPRYSGKNPRNFNHKYKELQGDPDTLAKVAARGKTPAGTHRPIMLDEILEFLNPLPGHIIADCTLGFGGHSGEILKRIVPDGHLVALDADPVQLPRTSARLADLVASLAVSPPPSGEPTPAPECFHPVHSNYAGLARTLTRFDFAAGGYDAILADLGLSSMQIDDPSRGFSFKAEGPLDMRMNPAKGLSARQYLQRVSPEKLALALAQNADEPKAEFLASHLAGQDFATTTLLAAAISALTPEALRKDTIQRCFQAIRIAVNDEFGALEAFLRQLPDCLKPGGKVAILTFHSGEDRRVKHAFKSALAEGRFSRISEGVLRPSPEEQRANPRSSPAKLRWAIR